MTTAFDYSLMLANEHTDGVNLVIPGGNGTTGYGHGYVRGHLFVAKLLYDFNAHVSGHVWLEYFIPGDFYAPGASDAVFFRWELDVQAVSRNRAGSRALRAVSWRIRRTR